MNPNLRTALLSRFIILKTGLCDKFDSKEQFLSAERYKTTKKISLSFFLRQAIFHFFFHISFHVQIISLVIMTARKCACVKNLGIMCNSKQK